MPQEFAGLFSSPAILAKKPAVLIAFLLAACLTIFPGQAADTRIYLTRGDKDNQPGVQAQSDFLCTDTIIAVLEGNWPVNTQHNLDAYWVNPQGEQQEHTNQKFTSYGATSVWVWLRLHPGERNLLDKMLMEQSTSLQEFVGRWEVVFYLDGNKFSRQNFTVAC